MQKSQKLKKSLGDVKSKYVNNSKDSFTQTDLGENESLKKSNLSKEADVKSTSSKMGKGKKDLSKRTRKTKFEEFLEIDRSSAGISAEEDLELERKLAKKLKVKSGKVKGEDDGINMLFKGISSVFDSLEVEVSDAEELPIKKKHKKQKLLGQGLDGEVEGDLEVGEPKSEEKNGAEVSLEEVSAKGPSRKKRRKRELSEQGKEDNVVGETAIGVSNPVESHDAQVATVENPDRKPTFQSTVKYVAPHLRSRAGNVAEEHTQIRRRIRGMIIELSCCLKCLSSY